MGTLAFLRMAHAWDCRSGRNVRSPRRSPSRRSRTGREGAVGPWWNGCRQTGPSGGWTRGLAQRGPPTGRGSGGRRESDHLPRAKRPAGLLPDDRRGVGSVGAELGAETTKPRSHEATKPRSHEATRGIQVLPLCPFVSSRLGGSDLGGRRSDAVDRQMSRIDADNEGFGQTRVHSQPLGARHGPQGARIFAEHRASQRSSM
jgi:hypothetical protein